MSQRPVAVEIVLILLGIGLAFVLALTVREVGDALCRAGKISPRNQWCIVAAREEN